MEPAGLWNFRHQPPTLEMNSYNRGAGSPLANLPLREFPAYGRYGTAGLFLNRQGKVLSLSTVMESSYESVMSSYINIMLIQFISSYNKILIMFYNLLKL